jgi:hypothetical protein
MVLLHEWAFGCSAYHRHVSHRIDLECRKATEYQKTHFLCKYFGFSIETRCKLPRKPSI